MVRGLLLLRYGLAPMMVPGGIGSALEFFWHRNVEGVDDGLCYVELGEVFLF